MEINNSELILISGGAFSWSASMLNAISRGIETVFNIGRSIGTSIRMIFSRKVC